MSELTNRITHAIGENPLEQIGAIKAANVAFHRQRVVVSSLQHGRKVVLSELVEMHRLADIQARKGEGKALSETRLESMARADKGYREHLMKLLQAEEKLAVLEADFWAKRSYLDVLIEMMRFARMEIQAMDYVT